MIRVHEALARLGLHTVDTAYRAYIDLWNEWYEGRVEAFHHYNVYNGLQGIGVDRASLNMAKTVCEDWANLLLNERTQIAVDNGQEALDAALRDNDFQVFGNRVIERAFALGTGAFSERVDGNGMPRIDYHDARSVWPLAWEGQRVTECAFSSIQARGLKKTLYLRLYRRDKAGEYFIENIWMDADSGDMLSAPDGVASVVKTGLKIAPFQIITPNVAVNIDTDSPMGLSVYANAIDVLKGLDATYDSFRNEFILGRKRLLVPASMTKIKMSESGLSTPLFDPNDLIYVAYEPDDEQKDGFHDLSPDIRAEQHLTGIQTQLNILSFKCGLGRGRYEFKRDGGIKTATEVVSEQSDLYQSMRKHQHVLDSALTGLCRALLALMGYASADVRITFDDSIIEDVDSERKEARDEVAAGLMSKYRYLTEYRGMSDEDALQELDRIRSESRVTATAVDWFAAENND